MKTPSRCCVAVVVLLVMTGPAGAMERRGRVKRLDLDGRLKEWSTRDLMYPDEQITDGHPPSSTYAVIYVANDESNLLVGLELKAPSAIESNWTHNLYIDTDMDTSTGFNGGWMTGGYDRLVQYGGEGRVTSVFEFRGPDRAAWSWSYLGPIGCASDRHMIEWAVPLQSLGLEGRREMRLEFHTLGPGVETETWAHSSEASVSTYTLADSLR